MSKSGKPPRRTTFVSEGYAIPRSSVSSSGTSPGDITEDVLLYLTRLERTLGEVFGIATSTAQHVQTLSTSVQRVEALISSHHALLTKILESYAREN